MVLDFLPLKVKYITKFCVLYDLSCGMLVYNVEKSEGEKNVAAFELLSLIKLSVTGLLFWIIKNELSPK